MDGRLLILGIFFVSSWLLPKKISPKLPPKLLTREEIRKIKDNDNKQDEIVPIEFQYVPLKVPFRYQRKWWKKETTCVGVTAMGVSAGFVKDTPVGIFVEDIPKNQKKNIIKL